MAVLQSPAGFDRHQGPAAEEVESRIVLVPSFAKGVNERGTG
jgi:hypothetical protein